MFKEDFVQTRKTNSQESPTDSVLMHSEQNDVEFTDQSKDMIIDQPPINDRKVHGYKSAIKRSRYKNRNFLLQKSKRKTRIHKLPHRLAFMNAVRSAWALHSNRRPHLLLKRRFKKHPSNLKQHKSPSPSKPPKITNEHPPITAAALAELSVPQLFSCLQIRHDLLMDPNLSFRPNLTPEKCNESEHYWNNLDKLIKTRHDHSRLSRMIRNILKELDSILVSLIYPFPKHPPASIVWNWPSHVTERVILDTLNPEFIQQQLVHGSLNIESKFDFVISLVTPLCPQKAEKIQDFVKAQEYAKSIHEIFLTLETIKLDVANKALRYYRPYLIDTGTAAEWRVFLNQLSTGEIVVTSAYDWLLSTWKRMGFRSNFDHVLNTGVINIITDDHDMIEALNLTRTPFPITFRYDEKRLKTQMRHEFQNIIVIALLLMPYRLMAGINSRKEHLNHLKSTYSKLLKDASMASGRVSCFHLALQACNLAKEVNPMNDDLAELAQYWSNWMHQNLRNASPVYRILYERIRSKLVEGLDKGVIEWPSSHATIGLEPEIAKLGNKIIVMVQYNKRIYRQLYYTTEMTIRRNIHTP